MALPNIKFTVNTSGIGLLADAIEKTPALIITGNTVANKVTIGQSVQLFSLQQAVDLGIEKDGVNAFAYKQLEAFYSIAGSGVPIWIMLVSDATSYETMVDVNEPLAKKLVEDAKGEVRMLGVLKQSNGGENIVNGIDEDVVNAIPKLQALCAYFANIHMPIRSVISGNAFNGTPADLLDYTTAAFNRVQMLLVNTDASKEACIGLELGRLAIIPSQRSIARVKDGAVEFKQAYFTNGEPVESLTDAWNTINDKGYVFMRTFPGRSGYFFTDDKMLTKSTDDFISLARGLVMDEAILIAQDVLVEELSDEIPVEANGNIHPAIIKSWQRSIEAQIEGLMVATGKLSAVSVVIDETQNVLATNKIEVSINLLPVGYAKYIEVTIGFTSEINE